MSLGLASDAANALADTDRTPRTIGQPPKEHPCTATRAMAPTERPRERLASTRAQSPGLAELIAVIGHTGSPGTQRQRALSIPMRAVNDHRGRAGLMAASLADLERIPGVGPVKAITLKGLPSNSVGGLPSLRLTNAWRYLHHAMSSTWSARVCLIWAASTCGSSFCRARTT